MQLYTPTLYLCLNAYLISEFTIDTLISEPTPIEQAKDTIVTNGITCNSIILVTNKQTL